jgi:predicted metal-binding membrane protein
MSEQRGVLRASSTRVLLLAAMVAWVLTVASTSGMAAEPGTMGRGLAGFLVLWALMMSAMMLPSVSPFAALYLRGIRADTRPAVRGLRTGALLIGYLAAWTAYGAVAFALARLGGHLAEHSPDAAPWVGAGALVVAGLYQLTPLKDFCLAHCRSPIGFLLHYGRMHGRLKDLRVGFLHGGFCVGCCWGLMLVLIAVGVMNLAWMVAIAAVVLIEKTWAYGRAAGIAVGVGLIVFATFVPAHPGLVPGLHSSMM